jgi:hypothetical protein
MSMRGAWVLVISLVAASSSVGLAVGCGGSSAGGTATSDGGDATIEDATPEGLCDAGSDLNRCSDAYPAQHHPVPQLDYGGGPILQHIRVVTVTFAGDPHRDAFRDFDHFLVTTPWWRQTAETFCIDGGTFAGQCVGDGTSAAPEGGAWPPDGSAADGGDGHLDVELAYDFASGSIEDADIQAWLARHITAGDFPPPDDQTAYVLFFPQSTTITNVGPSCVQFAGYHKTIPAPDGGGGRVSYAVIPYCDYGQGDAVDFQQATFATSHELAEMATDPEFGQYTAFDLTSNDAWLAQEGIAGGVGGECADMCFLVADPTYDAGGYTVTRVWSNQAAARSMQPCQPWAQTYHGAALRTAPQLIPATDSFPAHVSDGYVFLKRGQSTDIVADVFSQSALPHALLLYAGTNRLGATDPGDMIPPGDLIAVAFSQQKVQNGDRVVVTFTAPSTASTGDTWMVIRTVLEKNDFNDWPVIVHVE